MRVKLLLSLLVISDERVHKLVMYLATCPPVLQEIMSVCRQYMHMYKPLDMLFSTYDSYLGLLLYIFFSYFDIALQTQQPANGYNMSPFADSQLWNSRRLTAVLPVDADRF